MNIQGCDTLSPRLYPAHPVPTSTRAVWGIVVASACLHLIVLAAPWPAASAESADAAASPLQLQLSRQSAPPGPAPAVTTPLPRKDQYATTTPSPVNVAAPDAGMITNDSAPASDAAMTSSLPADAVAYAAADASPIANRNATCHSRTPPPYPATSRRLEETGRVLVEISLDAHGHVAAARVAASSGYHRLDAAALAAVTAWRCDAPLQDGRPVATTLRQTIDFQLN